MPFLPVEKQERDFDIILITSEAYVDHPSFGHAIISRVLESCGLSVGILTQPQNDFDYKKLGTPNCGFFISGGVVDSMVNNYTVAKMKRSEDVYSEAGKAGLRPDRCCNVYSLAVKRIFGVAMPVVIGGIEPSLRRFAHYDYWSDSVMPSILEDSLADLLIYGMGERPVKEIAAMLKKGILLSKIRDIRGTCYLESYENLSEKLKENIDGNKAIFCPSFMEVCNDKMMYVKAFNIQNKNNDHINGKTLLQKTNEKYVVQNPPQIPLSVEELDAVYALPYMRDYHPMYKGGVPSIEEVKFSISSHRGCFGGCNYCALTYHQGRIIQKRSKESIVSEATLLSQEESFKGYIHDVGGPTANFRNTACKKQLEGGVCNDKQCIGSEPCQALEVSHDEYLDILRTLREIAGIKKVFIRSGIRFDYLMKDKDPTFFEELVEHHISGQLKVAPEHSVDSVLKNMNKPPFEVYLRFKERFDQLNKKLGKKQFLVPYLISSHPGCTLSDAVRLSEYLKSVGYMPEQVQDFYPTPSTKSTCMYYTSINPDTMTTVYVARDREEKKMQRALMQYRKKENYPLILKALKAAGREDLIGYGEKCLIKPQKEEKEAPQRISEIKKKQLIARDDKDSYYIENGQVQKGKPKGKKPINGTKGISESQRRKNLKENPKLANEQNERKTNQNRPKSASVNKFSNKKANEKKSFESNANSLGRNTFTNKANKGYEGRSTVTKKSGFSSSSVKRNDKGRKIIKPKS